MLFHAALGPIRESLEDLVSGGSFYASLSLDPISNKPLQSRPSYDQHPA